MNRCGPAPERGPEGPVIDDFEGRPAPFFFARSIIVDPAALGGSCES
jgi:hypothetical protein